MTINVSVGKDKPTNQEISLSLVIRKTIDGNLMILDHNEIDIVIFPEEKKIVTFAKNSLNDSVYSCQERLFNFLAEKGIISRETVQGGNVYGSIEAQYPEAVQGSDATQLVTFTIGKFIEEEKPHMEMEEYYENEFEKYLTNPDEEETTDLGEVPQKAHKGSIDIDKYRRGISGYGAN